MTDNSRYFAGQSVKGIFYALIAALMLATMSMVAKTLGSVFNPIEITLLRNLVSLPILFGIIFYVFYRWKKSDISGALFRTERPVAQIVRAVVGTTGMFFNMWTVLLMPLSMAISFNFTAPLFVALLSGPLLKEKVGPFRIMAVMLGFIGILLIARPETDLSPLAIAVGLTAGFLNSLVAICLRWVGSSEHTLTTNFYFFTIGTVLAFLVWPFTFPMPEPDVAVLPAVLGLGIVGLLSLLFKTESYRLGPAIVISPVSYTIMVWALIYDYLIFDYFPDFITLSGASIVIASNLVIVWRESLVARNKAGKA